MQRRLLQPHLSRALERLRGLQVGVGARVQQQVHKVRLVPEAAEVEQANALEAVVPHKRVHKRRAGAQQAREQLCLPLKHCLGELLQRHTQAGDARVASREVPLLLAEALTLALVRSGESWDAHAPSCVLTSRAAVARHPAGGAELQREVGPAALRARQLVSCFSGQVADKACKGERQRSELRL